MWSKISAIFWVYIYGLGYELDVRFGSLLDCSQIISVSLQLLSLSLKSHMNVL